MWQVMKDFVYLNVPIVAKQFSVWHTLIDLGAMNTFFFFLISRKI